MTDTFTWRDAEDIAIALYENHPGVEPLKTRFTDMHAMVCALQGFKDDPKASSEPILEAIQMAWWEEWKDNQ